MFLLPALGVAAVLVQGASTPVGEAAKVAKTASGAEFDIGSLPLFRDAEAGYAMRIPAGYTRLTQDENREVFKNIGDYFGKEVSDRVLRQPTVYFKGPVDPAKPKALPPSLEISCIGAPLAVDRSAKAGYLEILEEDYRKSGIRHGDITIDFVRVSDASALRVEHDLYSPIDNSRSRLIRVLVSGLDRRYDIFFNFSPHQAEAVERALNVVLTTFKISESQMLDKTKWGRVALWTVGGFITGLVLSLVLKLLSGAGPKPQNAAQGKK